MTVTATIPHGLLAAFDKAQQSIFRLETRQHYAGDQEEGLGDAKRHWCDLVRRTTGRGVLMQRVHLIKHPLTDYIRFELDQSYPPNVEAGEDVRIAVDGEWSTDFWMFDDRFVWVMRYDQAGNFTGAQDASGIPTTVTLCRKWKQEALDASRSLTVQPQARAS